MLDSHPVGTSLVQLVLAPHVYLRLLQRVDFGFVRPLVAPFYSAIGRPSLDPLVVVGLRKKRQAEAAKAMYFAAMAYT